MVTSGFSPGLCGAPRPTFVPSLLIVLVLLACVILPGCRSASQYRDNQAPVVLAGGAAATATLAAAGEVTSVLEGGMAFMGGHALVSGIMDLVDWSQRQQMDSCMLEGVRALMDPAPDSTPQPLKCENDRWVAYIYPAHTPQDEPAVSILLIEKTPQKFLVERGMLSHPYLVTYPVPYLRRYLNTPSDTTNINQKAGGQ